MTARNSRSSRKVMGLLLAVIMVALVGGGMLAGCETPQERYRVLSFFFDGVPDPDAPKPEAVASVEEPVADGATVLTATVVTIHKPYKDRQCDSCHRAANGDIQEFEKAYDACIRCHAKVPTSRKLVHGPVAREACRFCHEAHESNQPALLKDTPIKVCTQCHDKSLLSNYPPQHVDGVTSCLECHFGHGGDARYYLTPAHANDAAGNDDAPLGEWPEIEPSVTPAEETLDLQGAAAGGPQGGILILAARPAGEIRAALASAGRQSNARAPAARERGR